MKKFIWAMLLLSLVGCANRNGSSVGQVIDVTKEGVFMTSCEVDVQYGKESSRVERFSTTDLTMCDELEQLAGKTIKLKYHYQNISIGTDQNDIINSFQVVE